jgi:hypothetical protein
MTPAFILMLVQSLIFIAAWLAIHSHVSRHGPIAGARTFTKYNSIFYSTASAILLFLILSSAHERLAKTLYHASKFYEYVDVLGVRAGGGEIGLHFGVHHLTTPYLTFFRVLQDSEGWQIFTALNAFHHVLMYAHFGGLVSMRRVLLITGGVQLMVGIAVDVFLVSMRMWNGSGLPLWPNMLSITLLSTYLVLWLDELKGAGMSLYIIKSMRNLTLAKLQREQGIQQRSEGESLRL